MSQVRVRAVAILREASPCPTMRLPFGGREELVEGRLDLVGLRDVVYSMFWTNFMWSTLETKCSAGDFARRFSRVPNASVNDAGERRRPHARGCR